MTRSAALREEQIARRRRIAGLSRGPEADVAAIAVAAERAGTSVELPTLPAGAVIRRVDDSGRIKLGGDRPVTRSLVWAEGCVDVHPAGPWLILTQPAHLVGARRRRNSNLARLVVAGGVERLCLAPAHLHALSLSADRHLLVLAVPGAAALVVANPAVCLLGAPAAVANLLNPPA